MLSVVKRWPRSALHAAWRRVHRRRRTIFRATVPGCAWYLDNM